MPKFKAIAEVITYKSVVIEAKNEQDAWDIAYDVECENFKDDELYKDYRRFEVTEVKEIN